MILHEEEKTCGFMNANVSVRSFTVFRLGVKKKQQQKTVLDCSR